MNKSILIIDDDKEVRTTIDYCLRKANKNYRIFEADDGKNGIELLKTKDIKVVILDLIMPNVNGEEVLLNLQDRMDKLRVIVLSGYSERLNTEDAIKFNVFEFLNKPVSLHPLLFAVESAFNDLRAKELGKVVESIKSIYKPILRDNLELKEVFHLLLKVSLKWTDAVNGSILIYDEINSCLKVSASQSMAKRYEDDEGRIIPIDRSISGKVFQSKNPILIKNVKTEPLYFEVRKGMLSEMAAPLLIENKCVGVINIESEEENHFAKEDLELLEVLAKEASIIIQNANLKEELIRKESFFRMGEISMQLTHGIGSIVGLINIQAQLLKEKLTKIDQKICEELIKDVETIIRQSNRATDAKNRILKCYQKLDELNEINVNELLKKLSPEKELNLENINVVKNLPEEPISVIADAEMLQVVFMEIIKNSVHAMKFGGTLTISAELNPSQELIFIEISDTGTGIKGEDIDKLFTPFFSRKSDEGSTGVGLWCVKEILLRFGGNIRLMDTKIDKSTTFLITLPVVEKN
ncbi:MAG: response regulator [Candidatus Hodarchaeota archaeon]